MTLVQDCPYDPPHTHEFSDDWFFGGANGTDPRADPRWKPTTYFYYDDQLKLLDLTQVPFCVDEAIDDFTRVAEYGNPVWLRKKNPDGSSEAVPFRYNKSTDEVFEL